MLRFAAAAAESAVSALVAALDSEREQLSLKLSEDDLLAMDRVLLPGRICLAVLADPAKKLEALLLPALSTDPDSVLLRRRTPALAAMTPSRAARAGGLLAPSGAGDQARLLNTAAENLRQGAQRAFAQWAAWSGARAGSQMAAAIRACDWAHVAAARRIWSTHSVTEESEAGAVVTSSVAVPAQPSSWLVAVLASVSRECARVGASSAAVTDSALGPLSQQLMQMAAATIEAVVAVPGAVSADGCTQLLFDFYVLGDVLLGPHPAPVTRAQAHAVESALKVTHSPPSSTNTHPHTRAIRGMRGFPR